MNTDQKIENIFRMLAEIKEELALIKWAHGYHFQKIQDQILASNERVHKRIGKAVIQLNKQANGSNEEKALTTWEKNRLHAAHKQNRVIKIAKKVIHGKTNKQVAEEEGLSSVRVGQMVRKTFSIITDERNQDLFGDAPEISAMLQPQVGMLKFMRSNSAFFLNAIDKLIRKNDLFISATAIKEAVNESAA